MLELSVKDFLTVVKGNGAGNRTVLDALTRTSDEHLANAARINRHIDAQHTYKNGVDASFYA